MHRYSWQHRFGVILLDLVLESNSSSFLASPESLKRAGCRLIFLPGGVCAWFCEQGFYKKMEAGTFQNFKPRSQKAAPGCRKTSCHATFELSEKNGIYLKEVWLVSIRCTWINSRDPGIASVADKCLFLFSATSVQKKGDFQKGQRRINNFLPFFLVTLHCTRSWGRAPQYLKTMVWTNCHQRFPGDPKHHITIPGEPPQKKPTQFSGLNPQVQGVLGCFPAVSKRVGDIRGWSTLPAAAL